MATRTMKKTVAFFEVCDDNSEPMAAEDWQQHLRKLRDRQRNQGATSLRHEIYGLRHYAHVYEHRTKLSLVVARERDEPPSSLDEDSGQIFDEQTQANRPWVEICVASFVENTNVFGFVLGGMASPRAGVIADWINEDSRLFGEAISVRPYVANNLVGMLQNGYSEARMVRLQLDATQIDAEVVDGSGLYSAAQRMGQELDLGPEVNVEVVLRIRGRSDGATEATRRSLADRARELIGRPVRSAQAEIVDFQPDSTNGRELVDLVKHRMATKEKVSVMDDDGHQVRIPSAIDAISRAASRLQVVATAR
ncbi:hypothetical protein [Georgenia faecalis]|uniref:Uncharacterized protein n=1 Tax=Georgenia faecalis TaxID=2483799 RepID=A0ABV9DBF0_9MICO|nr:hypothetical protein [Georgenia faecalis]